MRDAIIEATVSSSLSSSRVFLFCPRFSFASFTICLSLAATITLIFLRWDGLNFPPAFAFPPPSGLSVEWENLHLAPYLHTPLPKLN